MDNHLVQGYECLSSCLGYYFNQSFPAITGSEICLYGGAFSALYDDHSHVLSTPIYESNFVFLENNGVPYEHGSIKYDNPEVFVSESLASGKKVILKVSADFLMYDRVFRQADNSTHFICITGEDEDNYHVVDCYVPSRIPSCFSGPVTKSEILSAWKEKGFEFILLGISDLDCDRIICDITNLLRHSIDKYCGLTECAGARQGEKEVFRLLDYIEHIIDEPIFRQATLDINYQLKIYGFISTKIMLNQFLKRQGILENGYEVYDVIIEKWQSVCMHIVKLGITRKAEQYKKILTMVHALVKEEHQLLSDVFDALNQ